MLLHRNRKAERGHSVQARHRRARCRQVQLGGHQGGPVHAGQRGIDGGIVAVDRELATAQVVHGADRVAADIGQAVAKAHLRGEADVLDRRRIAGWRRWRTGIPAPAGNKYGTE
jgi:hypothetical protein